MALSAHDDVLDGVCIAMSGPFLGEHDSLTECQQLRDVLVRTAHEAQSQRLMQCDVYWHHVADVGKSRAIGNAHVATANGDPPDVRCERAAGDGMNEPRHVPWTFAVPAAELDARVYDELMRMARAQLAHTDTLTLDAPSLVHEAYLRFHRLGVVATSERHVFFAYCARVMRSVIIDYVRERRALKRGGDAPILTLTTGIRDTAIGEDALERLHEALQDLRAVDGRAHDVVELRYFGGLTEEEVAAALALSVPTVKRSWRKARAFLFDAMGP